MTASAPAAQDDQELGQELPIGYVLGEFTISSVLGAGGFGITYLADDTSLGRQVVIKENLPVQVAYRDPREMTVRSRQSGDNEDVFEWSIKSFIQEARTLASLDHPNIVKIIRTFAANGTAYFVMPFVSGKPLDSICKKSFDGGTRLEPEFIFSILKTLLKALKYLHSTSLLHRDIKPGNIMITTNNEPLLIDFGSARDISTSKTLTVIESAGYTPFEQMLSNGNMGPWSDLYSLGATFYKILTGITPPKCADRVRVDPIIKLSSYPELSQPYPLAFLSSIDKAMASFESDRYQSAQEWLDDLTDIAISPQQDQAPHPQQRKIHKQAKLKIPITAAACLLIAGGVYWINTHNNNKPLNFSDTTESRPAPASTENINPEPINGIPTSATSNISHTPLSNNVPTEKSAEDWYKEGDTLLIGNISQQIPPNIAEALKCFDKAAAMGHCLAQQRAGKCYFTGQGTAPDHTKAMSLFRQAAEQGDPEAQYFYAHGCLNGDGCSKNEAEALKWYQQSAASYPQAKLQLAKIYCSFDPPRSSEAIQLLEDLATNNSDILDLGGSILLSTFYAQQSDDKKISKIPSILRRFAQEGNGEAQAILGEVIITHSNIFSPEEMNEGIIWLERAAENGIPLAYQILGDYFTEQKNNKKAQEYYSKEK